MWISSLFRKETTVAKIIVNAIFRAQMFQPLAFLFTHVFYRDKFIIFAKNHPKLRSIF